MNAVNLIASKINIFVNVCVCCEYVLFLFVI